MGKVVRRTTVTEEILDEHEAEHLGDEDSDQETDEPEGDEDEEHEGEHPTVRRRRKAR